MFISGDELRLFYLLLGSLAFSPASAAVCYGWNGELCLIGFLLVRGRVVLFLVLEVTHFIYCHTRESIRGNSPPPLLSKLHSHLSSHYFILLYQYESFYHQKFTPRPNPFSLPPLNFPGFFFTCKRKAASSSV